MTEPYTVPRNTRYFEVTHDELVDLLKNCRTIRTTLGPRTCLIWEAGETMPDAVYRLGIMRGVLNENTDGAGI